MELAFIGIGNVGFALANQLQQKGHDILVAADDPDSGSVVKALAKNPGFQVLPIKEAIRAAEMVFLAIPFQANEVVLKGLDFDGKILVDCTNPVGPAISHGLKSQVSGAERVQQWAVSAKVVKAFTIYGYENLENAVFPGPCGRPVMMVASDSLPSKLKVKSIVEDMGFEMLDTGPLEQALHLEHMTLLWVKMVRRQGYSPHMAWAWLKR